MKVALVNPPWRFEGSIYFGCREAHLPLELGYARALLQAQGHRTATCSRSPPRRCASRSSASAPR